MSGQPKRRQVVERLEEFGGIKWLCEQIADGHSLRDIAADHFDCSRWLLQRNEATRRRRRHGRGGQGQVCDVLVAISFTDNHLPALGMVGRGRYLVAA